MNVGFGLIDRPAPALQGFPMQPTLTIEDILADITSLDRDGLRALARASERHLLKPRVPVASLEKDALTGAGDTLAARVQDDRKRAREALSGRLAEFKELRADHTYKTALNAAVDAAVLTVHASDHLGEANSNVLSAPWIEAFGDRPSGER
jgi:hypothetical protein